MFRREKLGAAAESLTAFTSEGPWPWLKAVDGFGVAETWLWEHLSPLGLWS
jgi:hypothetical protein